MARVQFLIDQERLNELDELVEQTGLKTRTQLLSEALTLYQWAVRQRLAGHIIAAVDEKAEKYKEVEMPGFPKLGKPKRVDFTTLFENLDHLYAQQPELLLNCLQTIDAKLINEQWAEVVINAHKHDAEVVEGEFKEV